MMSFALIPDWARKVIASAASLAENCVAAPMSLASFSSFLNSSPDAPEMAFTFAICCSKSAAT